MASATGEAREPPLRVAFSSAAVALRRFPAPDRLPAWTAGAGSLTRGDHGAASTKGRAMRRRAVEPAGSPPPHKTAERSLTALATRDHASVALPVNGRTFKERRQTHRQTLSGRCPSGGLRQRRRTPAIQLMMLTNKPSSTGVSRCRLPRVGPGTTALAPTRDGTPGRRPPGCLAAAGPLAEVPFPDKASRA